ncbi:hypothetical protein Taro_039664 [Colocasia esculenta]|uniref:Uncharacterized protein n=1 Tax=Colocasia esculenta TaxID=4460 RepID=A0A843WQT6_COLES|nr:hypothetical protein [Colocasia esculenta]
MVLLHAKGEAEDNQFLYECPAGSAIDDVSTAVVEIHNLQSKILQLARRLRERFFDGSPPESWTAAAISLYRATSEAASYASKDQVLHKRCLSPNILRDHLQTIEKELTVSPLMKISGTTLSQLLSGMHS